MPTDSNNDTSERANAAHHSLRQSFRMQSCIVCEESIGDMPGSRDAICPNCGYKDPCCE